MKRIVLLISVLFIGFGVSLSAQNVFVTKTGKSYHKETCKMVKKDATTLTIDQAKEQKLKPCNICYKEDKGKGKGKDKDKGKDKGKGKNKVKETEESNTPDSTDTDNKGKGKGKGKGKAKN